MNIFQGHNNSNDDALHCIFEFVGPGSYRYIGRVSRRFRTSYLAVVQRQGTTVPQRTAFQSAVASIDCAIIWIDEDERARDEICRQAAKYGSLEVLQWARAKGCPWDGDTCAYAAKYGHLEVLQWARANGCPWTEGTCLSASHGKPLAQAHCRTSK